MRATKKNIEAYRAAVRGMDEYDKFGKCYFFRSPTAAASRRKYEEQNSFCSEYKLGDDVLKISVDVSCSCKNVYADRKIWLNGVQLKNCVKAKNLLEKIGQELSEKGKL